MSAARRQAPEGWDEWDGERFDRSDWEDDSGVRHDPADLPLRQPNRVLETLSALSGGVRLAILLVLVALVCLVVLAFTGCPGQQAQTVQGSVREAAEQGAAQLATQVRAGGDDAKARLASGDWPVRGVVCIDAGHGAQADLTLTPIGPGSSEMQYVEPGGATGVVTGVPEYEVALEMALQLQSKLEAMGVTVVMVRTTNDVVLSSEQRAQIANEAGADLFIRLHCDGGDDPSTNGFSTLVPGYNDWTAGIYESSAQAAEIMHPIIIEQTGTNDMGIVERSDLAGFNFCQVPSVLFEMGYISNPDEDVRMNDPAYQDVLATAMANATAAYLRATS